MKLSPKVQCDKCSRQSDVETGSSYYTEPKGWFKVFEKDLCPKCGKEWKKLFDSFIREGYNL